MATQVSEFFEPPPRVTPADELAAIVQRAQALTIASGAAVAIREANTGNFVCRASSGYGAPGVGATLRVEGTFTGICIQSGKELICDDAEADARVDTAAIRALGIRSIAVTPIKQDGRVVGVLGVFSPRPHAFTASLVGVLNALAGQITGLLPKERRSKEERPIEVPLSLAKSSASPALPLPPIVLVPVVPPAPARSAKREEPAEPASVPAPAVSNTESIWAVPGASEIAPAMLALEETEKREQPQAEFIPPDQQRPEPVSEPAPPPTVILETRDPTPEKRERARPNRFLVIGAIIAVLALGVTATVLLRMRSRRLPTPVAPSQQQEHSGLSAPSAPSASAPAPQPGDTRSGAKPENVGRNASENKRSEKAQKADEPGASVPVISATVTSDSKITTPPVSSQSDSEDIAPQPGLGSSASDLSLLARPLSTLPTIEVHSALVSAKVVREVPAIYPPIAKARRIGGAVKLLVRVGKDGKVSNPRFISGPPVLRNAAFDSVKQWLFKPAMLNGQPIEQDTQVTVNFNP